MVRLVFCLLVLLLSAVAHAHGPAVMRARQVVEAVLGTESSSESAHSVVETAEGRVGGAWQVVQVRLFMYHGWNVVAEFDAASPATGSPRQLVQSYLWGTDLSGTPQGAGGVGGLLVLTDHRSGGTGSHGYAYDGNGNVLALVALNTGTISARYDYDPFGQPLGSSGPASRLNPYRFSTKYTDPFTHLAYYGYRFYDPAAGRWLSRDPIGEAGGVNLYGMLGNDPVNFMDGLGQEPLPISLPPGSSRGAAGPNAVMARLTAQGEVLLGGGGAAAAPVPAGAVFGSTIAAPAVALGLALFAWSDPGQALIDEHIVQPWTTMVVPAVEELSLAESGQADEDVGGFAIVRALEAELEKAKVTRTKCRTCSFLWKPHTLRHSSKTGQPLAWSVYQLKAAGPNELTIVSPGGVRVNFDGGEVSGSPRPQTAIEAKFGYIWMTGPVSQFTSRQMFAYLHASCQLRAQALMAALCGVNYEVRTAFLDAVRGFKDKIHVSPSPYKQF